MVVISIIYPCNYGCPNCPYTDGNSEIRKFYHERKGDLFPVELWKKIATEAGPHSAWLRCTGGGEPMLHPHMVDMIEFAKEKGARVWMNTNGSMFGPHPKFREKLVRVIKANIDLIEFSMDAGDAETYAKVRPPHGGPPRNPQKWWDDVVSNVKAALGTAEAIPILHSRGGVDHPAGADRRETRRGDRLLDEGDRRRRSDHEKVPVVGRQHHDLAGQVDGSASLRRICRPNAKSRACGRSNASTSIRSAASRCAGRTSHSAPRSCSRTSTTRRSRRFGKAAASTGIASCILSGQGAQAWPCRNCSAWLGGVRDWQHGWLKVLKRSGDHVEEVMRKDLGVEVKVYQPPAVSEVE